MVDRKAIPVLGAAATVETALRKLLKARLQAVVNRCRELDGSVGTIHQLRVSTRRATAALRLAKDHLPARKRRQTLDLLRDLRRSAGKVRDCDIYYAAVRSTPGAGETAQAFLTGLRAHRRMLDFNNVRELAEIYRPSLSKLAVRLPDLMESDGEASYSAHLHRHARRLYDQLAVALAEAAKATDPAHLHQVRIQAKRLRYTLELAGGKSDRFAPLLAQVESLQDVLGLWHDAYAMTPKLDAARAAAASINGAAGSPVMKAIDALGRGNAKTEARQLAAFAKWLRGWQAFRKRNPGKALFPKPQAAR